MDKLKILMIVFVTLLLLNNIGLGIRNNLLNAFVNCYFVLDGKFNESQLIESVKSYSFDINKDKDTYVISYCSNNILFLDLESEPKSSKYKLIFKFDHKYFDMQSIIGLINNYLKNDTTKKNLVLEKQFYYSDILALNLAYTNLVNANKLYNYKEIRITNSYVDTIKSTTTKYVSKIDIVMSHILEIYFQLHSDENCCNLIVTKADKSKAKHYIGNPVTFHQMQINKSDDKLNLAYQVRESYNKNTISLLKKINIYITSWYPVENYENKIIEINMKESTKTEKKRLFSTDIFILLGMENNDYVVNLFYL